MTMVHTVRDALRAEFDARGLHSDDTDVPAPAPDLLQQVLALCFPEYDLTGQVEVAFDSVEERLRIEQALLFGWATADVLAPNATDPRSRLLCGIFNLGIGMIDSLCDIAPDRGTALLKVVRSFDVESAASGPSQAGRMLASLPADAAADPTIAFTARVIDAFFALLHATHSPSLRRQVGSLLAQALAAEQQSVARSPASPHELLEASRNTSVLPFLIMATLVGGDRDAATHLGEAMWRIDDLVDLDDDACSGALNSLLLGGSPDRRTIEAVARAAADHLRAGLGMADRRLFLSFVQRYAGLTPESFDPAVSMNSSSASSSTGRSTAGGM
jgi:hypothetical protein